MRLSSSMVQGCRFFPLRLFLERWMCCSAVGLMTLLSRDFAHSKNNDTVPILSLMVIGLSRSIFSPPALSSDAFCAASASVRPLYGARISSGHAADVEERRFRTLGRQCSEDGFGVIRKWPVIEGEHHFACLQQMVAWILLPKPRAVCRVNLGHARNAESVGR